jgi:TRAP transporter TAXI family solute receptor
VPQFAVRRSQSAGRHSAFVRRWRRAAALAAAIVCASGCADGSRVRYLSIATGPTTGIYYVYGGAIAKIISDRLPGTRATAEATSASIDNMKFLRDRKADLALTLADTLADAAAGRGAFDGAPVPVLAVASLYDNYLHGITLASTGITRLEDLKGRVVGTGAPGSGTELQSLRVIRAAGLDPSRDFRSQPLGPGEGTDALKDGKIEALMWAGGLPTPAVMDLSHTPGVTLRLFATADVLPRLQREYGDSLYRAAEIPAGAYPGVDRAVPVVAVRNLLVARADLPEDLVYDITRLMFERHAELVAVHPEARNLTLPSAVRFSPAEFHPGAIRYYSEKSVWPAGHR